MSRFLLPTLTALACTVSAVGCIQSVDYVDPNLNLPSPFGNGEMQGVNVQNATLRGDIGPVRDFDGPASSVDAYDDAAYGSSNVTVYGTSARGTGFMMFNLDRSLTTLPAGQTRLLGSDFESSSYVQLCSDSSDAHFDGIAEEVVIEVTPRGNERDITVQATISESYDGAMAEPTVVNTAFTLMP
jgi:hypothetical protein